MVAQPLDAASIAVLPNGSSQEDGTIDILVRSYNFNVLSWLIQPLYSKFLCTKLYFSLGSSPTTIAFQFLYLFKIFMIAFPKIWKPLERFNFPTKEMTLDF